MKKTVIALATIGSLAGGALIATAEAQMAPGAMQGTVPAPVCGERVEMVKALHEQFREEPQAVGKVDSNALIEVFVSHTGTWTILATGTDGKSCLVASGEGWDSQSLVIGVDA